MALAVRVGCTTLVALGLWGMFPSAGRGQTPSNAPRFDARRLPQRSDTFAQYYIRGPDTTRGGTAISTLRSDGTYLTRIYADDDPRGSHYDTIVDRFDGLRPVSYRSHTSSGSGILRFEQTAVTGWMWLPNGDSVPVNTPIPPVVYNGASFDLMVRASDLREGFQLSVQGFQIWGSNVVTLQGRVTGTEVVDGQACWVFRGSNGLIPVTFWVDQKTRALRRQLIQFQVESFHLLASPPPGEARVTDAEKNGLTVGVAALRHPDFGFVAPLPGSHFALDTLLQRRMNANFGNRPDLFLWAVRDSAQPGFAIMVQVFKGFEGTEGAMRRFPKAVLQADFSAKSWEVSEDSVYWEGERREYRASVRDARGVYLKTRCIPSPPAQTPAVVVCVMTVGTRGQGLDVVMEGLQFGRSPE